MSVNFKENGELVPVSGGVGMESKDEIRTVDMKLSKVTNYYTNEDATQAVRSNNLLTYGQIVKTTENIPSGTWTTIMTLPDFWSNKHWTSISC